MTIDEGVIPEYSHKSTVLLEKYVDFWFSHACEFGTSLLFRPVRFVYIYGIYNLNIKPSDRIPFTSKLNIRLSTVDTVDVAPIK